VEKGFTRIAMNRELVDPKAYCNWEKWAKS
jgi:hypothetical protein